VSNPEDLLATGTILDDDDELLAAVASGSSDDPDSFDAALATIDEWLGDLD
jgi:hypothetical protein